MYLGTSRSWWAYLAIKSNPSLLDSLPPRTRHILFFDDPGRIPEKTLSASDPGVQFFYILWDGMVDEPALQSIGSRIGSKAAMTLLSVGDVLQALPPTVPVRNLYADGDLHFTAKIPPFTARTQALLLANRAKNVLMPLKNLLQSPRRFREGVDLLFGSKRLVFCGSFGLSRFTLWQFCERHVANIASFQAYEFDDGEPSSIEDRRRKLSKNGTLLANLFLAGTIDPKFFLTLVHLLGREYFLERVRFGGLPLFAHSYAAGTNINVYTTPFYAQHVFLDFGSAVGTGNYPRRADLRFYNKKMVLISLGNDSEQLASMAATGSLDEYFEQQWQLYAAEITASLQKR